LNPSKSKQREEIYDLQPAGERNLWRGEVLGADSAFQGP